MQTRITRRRIGLIVAIGAVIAIVGKVAYSAIPDSGTGIITGCYSKGGALRVIDAQAGDTCAKNETLLAWNQTGPQGPAGPSDALVAETFPLSPLVDNTTVTLRSYTVPPGSYVIDALTRIRGGQILEGETSVFCELYAGIQQLDTFFTIFLADEEFKLEAQPLVGWFDSATPTTIEVRCRANYTNFLSTIGADAGRIVATRVGSVTVN